MRMRSFWAVTLFFVLVLAPQSAFAQTKEEANVSPSSGLADRVKELEANVKSLWSVVRILMDRTASDSPELDCATNRVTEVQLGDSALTLFATCERIDQYLEGHKIKLLIGNPYSFNFNGLNGKLSYGQTSEDAFTKGRTAEISSTQELRSGAWLPIEVIVNPSKPSELRSIHVELTVARAGSK